MSPNERTVTLPPKTPVIDGICQMGTYNAPYESLNLLEAKRPLGKRYPSWVTALRLKEWEAFQFADEHWFGMAAVSNLKLVGIALLLLFDKETGKLYEYVSKGSSGRFTVPNGISDSVCSHTGSRMSIQISNRLKQGEFSVLFEAKAHGGQPACRGEFTAYHVTEPIVILQPFGKNRPLYSHKALMPAAGEIRFGEKVTRFTKEQGAVVLDDHKGYYPFSMHYDWATACANTDGVLTGFNLTRNQVLEPARYNENCLWKDGRMIPLPPVSFQRPDGLEGPWRIRDRGGRVDLTFTPKDGLHNVMKLGPISTDYYSPFGTYSGFICDDEDHAVSFDGYTGMAERREDRL